MSKASTRIQTEPQKTETSDPVLAMVGVGKQLWARESGDRFVERLRSEDVPPIPMEGATEASARDMPESVWRRIKAHQNKPFKTVTGLPFRYEVEGAGIWFFRDGRRVNRKLSRAQVEVAISRCPLTTTTEISDSHRLSVPICAVARRTYSGRGLVSPDGAGFLGQQSIHLSF